MGVNNSMVTRVVPAFDFITGKTENLHAVASDNLKKFFNLFNVSDEQNEIEIFDFSKILDISYGKNEKKLAPPRILLDWAVEQMYNSENDENKAKTVNIPHGNNDKGETLLLRKRLANGEKDVYDEAKKKLTDVNIPYNAWYIFEGLSSPDIYIETNSHIFVGEAKRTEPILTTKTTWLKHRDQLIRHIDAVIDTGKIIRSFFIFEKKNFDDNKFFQIMDRYKDYEYYRKSLPHRTDPEIKKIMDTYIGYIFWEKIQKTFPKIQFNGMF